MARYNKKKVEDVVAKDGAITALIIPSEMQEAEVELQEAFKESEKELEKVDVKALKKMKTG